MSPTRRRLMEIASAATLLAACQQGGTVSPKAKGEDASDMALGDPNSPVTLIEYASVTCSHCAEFHAEVWPDLRANYIDTGKIRFIFREFPTPPQQVAVAGFQIARCDGRTPEQYFAMIDVLFDQQVAVFQGLQRGTVRETLLNIARSSGLSEEQFDKCVKDPEGIKRVQATVAKGVEVFKVEGTPTLILNGEKLGPEAQSYDSLAKLIDAKLASG